LRRFPFTRALVFGLALAPSLGATEPVPFRVVYRGPSECTDARGFAAGIMQRTTRARVEAGEDTTTLWVTVEKKPPGYRGSLRAVAPGQPARVREVEGDRCSEVVEALSLIAALALDPEAGLDSHERVAPRPEPTPAPTPSAPSARWSFGIGAHATPYFGAVPSPGVGYGIHLRVALRSNGFAPLVRAHAERLVTSEVERATGSAEFGFWDAGLLVCPFRVPATGAWSGRACAGFEAGVVSAEGRDVTLGLSSSAAWLSPSLSLLAEWEPSLELGVFVEAGAALPLARRRYHFDNGERVFETPDLAGFFRAGVAYTFP